MKQRDRAYKNAYRTPCSLEHARHEALSSAVSNQLGTLQNKYMSTRLQNAQSLKAKWTTLKRMGTTKQKHLSPFNYFTADELNTHFAATLHRHSPLTSLDLDAAIPPPLLLLLSNITTLDRWITAKQFQQQAN